MPVICRAKPCLAHKFRAVGCLDAHIFILCLINLFMSVTNGSIGARLDRTQGTGPFTWTFWDLTSFSNFKCFWLFRSPGRKPSPCAVSSGQVDDFAPALLFVQSVPPSVLHG